MRISSRAIIIENGKLLTMFRRKINNGKVKEYYVIPGGGMENGETKEENVIRELKEEMNVDIRVIKYLGKIENNDRQDNYFLCKIINGTPHLGGEELEKNCEENYYMPVWIDLKDLDNADIAGKDLVKKCYNLLNYK